MANVAHSTLTGSNLHENKGVASATDNTVATASSGATVWKKLDNTNLAALGNPFGANLLHVREEQSSGVASTQTFGAGTWNTVVLNTTKTNEISSASVSSNQISLPAGTYYAEGFTLAGNSTGGISTTSSRLRLRNITDSTDLVEAPYYLVGANTNSMVIPTTIRGRFTISGTKTIELQLNSSASYRPAHSTVGAVEVYTELLIWRVA